MSYSSDFRRCTCVYCGLIGVGLDPDLDGVIRLPILMLVEGEVWSYSMWRLSDLLVWT